jgi:type I restriction-modification system DNA methylase subunit
MNRLKSAEIFGLKSLPAKEYFSSIEDVDKYALNGQAHYMRRAFQSMALDGIFCIEEKPTVYLKNFTSALTRSQINQLHQKFWNQSIATILILQDPQKLYIFSGMVKPNNDIEKPIKEHKAFIRKLKRVADTLERYKLFERITTGEYYRSRPEKFNPKGTVDHYLIDQLKGLSDQLAHKDTIEYRKKINSFVGRLIFTCYLIDREIISLNDYNILSEQKIRSLLDLFELNSISKIRQCLTILFTSLKKDFNGSMFEEDFDSELSMLTEQDLITLQQFLQGQEMGSRQMVLGFWAYDFSVIPVETISAIYESLLEIENPDDKKSKGAFYTPRYLAEMVVDEAVSDLSTLLNKTFLDPSCGSGIFLVTLFNRMADECYERNKILNEKSKINELKKILKENLYGIDVNPTACRITCFSLYIAFLDQFEPRYLQTLQNRNGKILPKLLAYEDQKWQNIKNASIFQGNFFQHDLPIQNDFDVIIGNPPWPGRTSKPDKIILQWLEDKNHNPWLCDPELPMGKTYRKSVFFPSNQVAHTFMWKALLHLKESGNCCMVLPSGILLNKTDDFQKKWFKKASVDKIIHLADYRHLLFERAIHPCFIACFNPNKPDIDSHIIHYIVPKYLGQDPVVGKIPVTSDDCVIICLKDVIDATESESASVLWKSRHSGSPRDWQLINYLQNLPTLSQLTGPPKSNKPWKKGKGFKVWYQAAYDLAPTTYGDPKPISGSLDDPFIEAKNKNAKFIALSTDCITLKEKLETVQYKNRNLSDSERQASLEGFHRNPERCIFQPPMILINKGFNRFLFSEFFVFYQDSVTGISGPDKDKNLLIFLSVYAQSRLASYFQYHTSGSWGIERPEVRLHELLKLPFPIPHKMGMNEKKAQQVVKKIASKVKVFKKGLEKLYEEYEDTQNGITLHGDTFDEARQTKSKELTQELEPLVYEYFGLTKEEIALVEDTCEIYEKSATPNRYDKSIKTLQETTENDRFQYSKWLCDTLNNWIQEAWQPDRPSFFFFAESTRLNKLGQVLISLCKTKSKRKNAEVDNKSIEMINAFKRISTASISEGGSLTYLRGIVFVETDKIHILKPDMLGKWTRTSALNDAQDLFDLIVTSPKRNA